MRFRGWRIGNICHNMATGGGPVVITKVKPTGVEGYFLATGVITSFSSAVLKPLPITTDRLEKFHFTKVNKSYCYNNCWIIQGAINPKCFMVEFINTRDTIEFVHELQNLYFHEKKEELHIPFGKKP